MSEEQSNFKVTDRRLFNADGSPREVPAEQRPQEPPAAESAGDVKQSVSDDIVDATYSETPAAVTTATPGAETADAVSPVDINEITGATSPTHILYIYFSISINST